MKYIVVGRVAHVGTDMVLQLSKNQIAARAHVLEKVKGGHRPKAVVQFKKGEEIGITGKADDLPRSLISVLAKASNVKAKTAKDDDNPDGKDIVENKGDEDVDEDDDIDPDGDDEGGEDET